MDKLLKLLDENARLTNAQLASMLGTSEQDVANKIKELEKDGVIRGYKPIVNWEKAGRECVTALIELKVTPKRALGFDEIARTILAFDEVESVYLMSGGYDLAVTVNGKTFQELAMFVAKRLSPLDDVLSTATSFVLRPYKRGGRLYLAEEPDERECTVL